MRTSTPFPLALLTATVCSIGLTGCVDQPPPPPLEKVLTPLTGAPDGSAEVLRVDADSRNTVDHEEGSFLEFANEPNRVVLVDFWAPTCGPCVKMGPDMESLARQFPNEVSVVKVDIDENANSALAMYFGLSAIPDLRVFVNGRPVDHIKGYASARTLVDILTPHIATLK